MSGLITTVPDWWAEQHADEAAPLLQAALAEAGYPRPVNVRSVRGGPGVDQDRHGYVPPSVFNRARSLLYMRFGIEHEWCPTCPDGWFSSDGVHASSCELPAAGVADTDPTTTQGT